MENFSIGILSWHSTDVLINTLTSYHNNGLLSLSNDVNIWFQEFNETDKQIADHFGIKYIGSKTNEGIGQAFHQLAKNANNDNILLLEHDWELVEDVTTTSHRIQAGIKLLDSGYECIRYRHKDKPGYPHFSIQKYKDRELSYIDPEIKAPYPHLLDSIHWKEDPSKDFPLMIGRHEIDNEIFWVSPCKYASWTNNPCLYKRQFYLDTVKPFVGHGIDLEGKISLWWNRQNFNVAHSTGIFQHNDWIKYGRQE